MPIYEFYCCDCHTIYSFFARRVETERSPACPQCGRSPLERQVSRFAFSSGSKQDAVDGPDADSALNDVDEARMEQAMAQLAASAEGMDENDPRAMAHMMRRVFESTGLPMNESIQEAIRRMEAGEDPDQVDEELGDALDAADPFAPAASPVSRLRRRLQAPTVDPQVYDM